MKMQLKLQGWQLESGKSLNKIKKSSLVLLVFALLQIILLSIFKASLLQFSLALMVSDLLLLAYSIIIIRK